MHRVELRLSRRLIFDVGARWGVTGALFFLHQAGFSNILTFDMGGTSTDVALIRNGRARVRRETFVGDVRVRAPSVDVRTVGAGGGSIAFVRVNKALRVGPESAGAVPGPACYMKGGEAPTVCDINVVLGYLPSDVQLGGDMQINRDASVAAVQSVADAMGIDLMAAAEGIIKIVNESNVGCATLVSVEQGYDPRDFALVGFGGLGHYTCLGILTEAWPSLCRREGVLCAYGDTTTRVKMRPRDLHYDGIGLTTSSPMTFSASRRAPANHSSRMALRRTV